LVLLTHSQSTTMHTSMRRRPHVACVLVVLTLAAMAVPLYAAAAVVAVSDEAGLRAAVAGAYTRPLFSST